MEQNACQLVLRIAQEFSDAEPFGSARSAGELAKTKPEVLVAVPTHALIRTQIENWKLERDCVVGLALGCNSEIRKWPVHYFVELAKEVLRLGPVRIVFIGGPGDQEEAARACFALNLDP